MSFGEKMQKLRKAKGFSQEELAQQLSVSRQTISKWELNQSTPELDYIAQISDIFQVTTDYLIKAEYSDKAAPPEAGKTEQRQEGVWQTPASRSRFSSCFLLGLVLTVIGWLGMFVFVVLSILEPWTVYIDHHHFTGLWGFLAGTHSFPYFAILLVMAVGGLCVSIYGIVKKNRSS